MRKRVEVQVDNTDVITLIRHPVSDIVFHIYDRSSDEPALLCGGVLPLQDYMENGCKFFVSSYINVQDTLLFSVRLSCEYEYDDDETVIDETVVDDTRKVGTLMKINDERNPLKNYSEIACGSIFSFMSGKPIYAIKTDLDAGQNAPVAVDLATGKHRLLSPNTMVYLIEDAELTLK